MTALLAQGAWMQTPLYYRGDTMPKKWRHLQLKF